MNKGRNTVLEQLQLASDDIVEILSDRNLRRKVCFSQSSLKNYGKAILWGESESVVTSRQTARNLPLLNLKEAITEYRTKQEIAKTYIGFMRLRAIF